MNELNKLIWPVGLLISLRTPRHDEAIIGALPRWHFVWAMVLPLKRCIFVFGQRSGLQFIIIATLLKTHKCWGKFGVIFWLWVTGGLPFLSGNGCNHGFHLNLHRDRATNLRSRSRPYPKSTPLVTVAKYFKTFFNPWSQLGMVS